MPPRPKPARFEEAVAWFRARVPMSDAEYDALEQWARNRAFKVTGVAQLDLVQEVWEAIDRAIAKGTTLEDFKAAVGEKLSRAWGKENPARLETIFRTNVQGAYSAGRTEQLRRPVTMRLRPFWKYSAVLDSRTSDICRPLNGTILPADDPWWRSHTPPLHHRCRGAIMALTGEQADEAGGSAESPPDVSPAEGFGGDPTQWEPKLEGRPVPLVNEYRSKAR